MFGFDKKSSDGIGSNDIETIIGKNTVIKGEINGSGNLRIDGIVEGGIDISSCVVVGECGHIKGDVNAREMIISGRVDGNVTTDGCLSIYSSGQLVGDVKVGSLRIDEGGVLKGRSEMSSPPDAESVSGGSRLEEA